MRLDYTCRYENNTAVGEADVTITPVTGRRSRLTGEAVTKHFLIVKQEQKAPKCSLSFLKNADGETFTAVIENIEGAEYSFDGEHFSSENRKTDCAPETSYTGYIRMKETERCFASPASQDTQITPKKQNQTPEPEEKTLAAPSILSIKASAEKSGVFVTISVSPVNAADRYEVYRTVGTATAKVGTILSGQTSLQDKNPVKSASYYAVAISGDGTVKSSSGEAKTFQLGKAVKIKKVTSAKKGITVFWKKNKKAVKYVIYRSSKKNTGYTKIKTLGKKKVSFADTKAKKGKSYYYKIAVITKSSVSLMSSASKKVKRK